MIKILIWLDKHKESLLLTNDIKDNK